MTVLNRPVCWGGGRCWKCGCVMKMRKDSGKERPPTGMKSSKHVVLRPRVTVMKREKSLLRRRAKARTSHGADTVRSLWVWWGEREREMRTFWNQYFQQQEMVLNVNRIVLYVHFVLLEGEKCWSESGYWFFYDWECGSLWNLIIMWCVSKRFWVDFWLFHAITYLSCWGWRGERGGGGEGNEEAWDTPASSLK